MSIEEITEYSLLQNPKVKSVDFENENYFSVNDLNNLFMGTFRDLYSLPLPVLHPNNERYLTSCVSWKSISDRIEQLRGKSEFEKRINTALNFNPNKR